MRKTYLIDFGLLLALLLVPAVPESEAAEKQAGTELMAQNGAGETAVPGRDVLVSGTGAVIDSQSRTRVRIDVGAQPMPAQPKLELLLSPSEVASNEPYLIVVESGEGAGAKRLGTVSFYPPKAGAAQAFYFDAAPLVAELKARGTTTAELSLSLAPAEKTQRLTSSRVRLLGARLVGN